MMTQPRREESELRELANLVKLENENSTDTFPLAARLIHELQLQQQLKLGVSPQKLHKPARNKTPVEPEEAPIPDTNYNYNLQHPNHQLPDQHTSYKLSTETTMSDDDIASRLDNHHSEVINNNEQISNNTNNISNNISSIVQHDPLKQRKSSKLVLHENLIDGQQCQIVRPYPKKVFLIVANEFCERFSYYGLRAVLVLYFKQVLGYSDSLSTVSFHLFATLSYLTPVVGAILADSVWGKYRTILNLSLVYLIGELVLVVSSLLWHSPGWSNWLTLLGLALIGFGMGGIKPCVSAFGGDQFLPQETQRRAAFFSIFYAAINAGSLISHFVTPILRSEFRCAGRMDCYPLAFGLPLILMFISIVCFLTARNYYTYTELPEQNVILAFVRCLSLALRRKWFGDRPKLAGQSPSSHRPLVNQGSNSTLLTSTTSSSSFSSFNNSLIDESNKIKSDDVVAGEVISNGAMCQQNRSQCIAACENKTQISIQGAPESGAPTPRKRLRDLKSEQELAAQVAQQDSSSHWIYLASDQFDRKSLDEFRSVLAILLVFLPIPVYWCLFDQQSSLWTLQALRMDGHIAGNFYLQPDQIGVVEPVLLLTMIPIFQFGLYPLLGRFNLLRKPLSRMTAGGFLAALTFVVSAAIQIRIRDHMPPMMPEPGNTSVRLVNGLAGCTMSQLRLLNDYKSPSSGIQEWAAKEMLSLSSLESGQFLAHSENNGSAPISGTQSQSQNQTDKTTTTTTTPTEGIYYEALFRLGPDENRKGGCAISSDWAPQYLKMGPMRDRETKLVYAQQGNGRLYTRTLNDNWALPEANKARVRFLYEPWGSYRSSQKNFSLASKESLEELLKMMKSNNNNSTEVLENKELIRYDLTARLEPPASQFLAPGQPELHAYQELDIQVPSMGAKFYAFCHDKTVQFEGNSEVVLKPGTVNLLVAQSMSHTSHFLRHTVIRDSSYRISMLWQLPSYLMISMSEVLLSITGLEFSYSMAPDTMKSVILAAFFLTTAMGNLLTVAIESFHPFEDVTHDFLFYALLMALASCIFMLLARNFKPYKSSQQNSIPSSVAPSDIDFTLPGAKVT